MPTETPARPLRCARILEFPDHRSLGTLCIRDVGLAADAPVERSVPAQGPVVVPPGKEAVLWVTAEAFAFGLEPLASLPADALDAVVLYPNRKVMDVDVAHLEGLTGLRFLDLCGTKVTDWSCDVIGELPKLEWLSLTGAAISDRGMRRLRRLHELRRLSLKHTGVGDFAIPDLVQLPNLEWLSLTNTKVTGAGLVALAQSHSLRAVSVAQCAVTADDEIAYLAARPTVRLIEH